MELNEIVESLAELYSVVKCVTPKTCADVTEKYINEFARLVQFSQESKSVKAVIERNVCFEFYVLISSKLASFYSKENRPIKELVNYLSIVKEICDSNENYCDDVIELLVYLKRFYKEQGAITAEDEVASIIRKIIEATHC